MKERVIRGLSACLAIPLFSLSSLFAQTPLSPQTAPFPTSVEEAILQNLAADTVTAPYRFGIDRKNGRLVLTGRVGTKVIHDTAVRIALLSSASIDDRIVIDTAVVYRPENRSTVAPGTGTPVNRSAVAPAGVVASTYGSGPIYAYPPPLFGRLDDPFWGFEPPVISYPPWWQAVAARRGDPYAAPVLNPFSPIGADPGPSNSGVDPAIGTLASLAEAGRSVELSIDPRGVGLLRGTVGSEDVRLGIANKASKLPGVKEIINKIEVDPTLAEMAQPIGAQDQPPPPPQPMPPPIAANPNAPERLPNANPQADSPDSAEKRLAKAIERRPALEKLGIKSEVKEGVAYLSGKVPTVLEAMLAFRAAQQTVGVRDVVDRLEFAVPDGIKPNPLIATGRPEDVEPYLEAQIRRQVNDRAHIDRVRVTGDRLELRGTVSKESDRAGVEAILRSMPLLRGYTIDARLNVD